MGTTREYCAWNVRVPDLWGLQESVVHGMLEYQPYGDYKRVLYMEC